MTNMNPKKCPMPSRDPQERKTNFEEVATGYTYEMAIEEAKRCFACKHKPCRSKCPVGIDIPAFIERLAAEDIKGAYEIISQSSNFPAVCGRVCPQESQCESVCVRGIKGESVSIGRLERFVADYYREHYNELPEKPESNGKKVAIVGAGPSGLMCACKSSENNQVIVIEKNEKAGKKIYITGKGRCNVTNNCSTNEFINNVVTNAKFLYSSINTPIIK